jgi:heat-inducible transcriptional repressor
MLTVRQKTILHLVVRRYIATAVPVGSGALAGQPGLNVSSATIRHEMASLEEAGYLTHPYTSAGRMPTEKGYRYFVEHLMEERALSKEEQRMIRHQFHQVRMDLDQWLRLSVAILARSAQNAALVTAPKAARSRLKHLDLISVSESAVLLLLVFQEGSLRQEILTSAPLLEQGELSRIANELNVRLGGLTSQEIRTQLASLQGFKRRVSQHLIEVMAQVDQRRASDIYHDGVANILRQPEFAEAERVERVLGILERRTFLESLLAEVELAHGEVQILIGGEGRWREARDCSIVLARYGVAQEALGILGVLGPMRMPYERCISAVRYVANLMTDLFSESYGLTI